MTNHDRIIIKGLNQNSLKNISLDIPKEKIVVFTGVSGSGKSSIVFDTVAAESRRQMNETYIAFMRGRLPKFAGTASYFSFNDPNGMCPKCFGIGEIMKLDILPTIAPKKSGNEGMGDLPAFHVNTYYWKQYTGSGLFDLNKKWRDYIRREQNLLLYGAYEQGGEAR